MTNFECDGCSGETFVMTTRSMVGSDDDYIGKIVCAECGSIYTTAPRPTRIKYDE